MDLQRIGSRTVQEILPCFVDLCTRRAEELHLAIVEPHDASLVVAVSERSSVRSPFVLDRASCVCQFGVPALDDLRTPAAGEANDGVETDAG